MAPAAERGADPARVRLRPAGAQDRAAVRDVFNHHALHGFAVYRENAVDETIFDFFAVDAHAFLVAEEPGGAGVIGFGALRRFKPAPSFDATAQISAFLLPAWTRAGLGSRLLEELTARARGLGIVHLLGHVSSRNTACLAFLERSGFAEVGRLRGIGRKLGRSFDVVWMQKELD
jgi:phosphinothricin acetyltransferase